jgi:transcriptional regulatory protein LevR
MIIEFNDEETRLLHNILLEQAVEHLTYANPSEVAERLFKLATRFERSVKIDTIHIA